MKSATKEFLQSKPELRDWLKFLGIATDERGFIKVDENGRTSHPKVLAGGDNTHGPDLVVTAVAAGRRAGHAILSACRSHDLAKESSQ